MLFVTNLLRKAYRGGPTLTHKALRYLKEHSFTPERGDRLKYANVAVIFTDGKSRRPWMTKKYANALHRTKASVYVIGIGPGVRKREIYYMASQPKRFHMMFTSFPRLDLTMKTAEAWICRDVIPLEPSIRCNKTCHCPAGMRCCNKCCVDIVTLAICPTCSLKQRCGNSKHCPSWRPICWRGCCHSLRYVKREACKSCRTNYDCRHGGRKCCRGCCRNPVYKEVDCDGSIICQKYPAYTKCGRDKRCCKNCAKTLYYR